MSLSEYQKQFKKYMLSVQRALLGNIIPNIRAVTVAWENDKLIHIRFILDRQPTDFDYDLLHFTTGEVIADFPYLELKEECIFSDAPYLELPYLDAVAYLRYEEIPEQD